MAAIHLIEKAGTPQGLRQIDKSLRTFESGYWKVTKATAQRLVGGAIFLHTAWADTSHFGGEITGFRMHKSVDPSIDGRVVFAFDAKPDKKGVRAPLGAAGEKRIVW